MERQWKLGDDIHKSDNILDPITFDDIILAAHCNERILDVQTIKRTARDILESRLEDYYYLLDNNINEIIAEAAKGRE
jgi:hypothetical protein